jgi:V/A-type H+-transporting ATPase subunit B
VRNLASIIGEEELSAADKRYLYFGERFEQEYLSQSETEDRSIETTLDLGWKILSILPKEELLRIKRELIEKYLDPILAKQGDGATGMPTNQSDMDEEEPEDSRMRSTSGRTGR